MAVFTKQAIKWTFMKMLSEKPLTEITVKALVETCGINRKTFYYHYRDIPDLMEEIVREKLDGLMERYDTFNNFEECMEVMSNYLTEQRHLMLNIYRSANRENLEKSVMKLCDYVVRCYIDGLTRNYRLNPENKEHIITLYRGEIFGLLMDWMMQGMPDDSFSRFHRVFGLHRELINNLFLELQKT